MFAPRGIAHAEGGHYSVTAGLDGGSVVALVFEVTESSDGDIVVVSIPEEIRAATGPDTRPAKPLFEVVLAFHRAAVDAGRLRLRDVRVDGPSSYAGTVLAPGAEPASVVFTVDAAGSVRPPDGLPRTAGADGVLAAVACFHRARSGIVG
jgi:hypothetical protein